MSPLQRSPSADHATGVALHVEDSRLDALLFRRVLQRTGLGLEVVVVPSVVAAARVLLREQVTVVITDLDLEHTHGLDTVKQLLPWLDGRPLVVLSSSDDDALLEQTRRFGVKDCLHKRHLTPVALASLLMTAITRPSRCVPAARPSSC